MAMILAYVLAYCALLVPQGRDHTAFAVGTAAAIADAEPIFKDDKDKKKTAAFMVAIAFRESSFRTSITGDSGKSFGAFQIHLPFKKKTVEGWSGEDILADPEKGARVALRMIRESVKACPAHPLAVYAEGGDGCASPRAQRISKDRLTLGKWLERHGVVTDEAIAAAEEKVEDKAPAQATFSQVAKTPSTAAAP
jgi:hypothetical protein